MGKPVEGRTDGRSRFDSNVSLPTVRSTQGDISVNAAGTGRLGRQAGPIPFDSFA